MHERLKLHLWRVLTDVIPLRWLFYQHIGKRDGDCVSCEVKEELSMNLVLWGDRLLLRAFVDATLALAG